MDLLEKFNAFIKKENLFNKKDKLLLAVSGGIDSVVLCELCKRTGYEFSIAHCNFQLRAEESDRDEQLVKELASKYGVKFFIKRFATAEISKKQKKSIEETARGLRYEWFYELLTMPETHQWILTAHHADDNIETLLMNFFRGTGIKGLHGILPKKDKIIRPLLFAGKHELEAFAKTNELHFAVDKTNAQNEFTRNFFRNKVIPLVMERFPEAKFNLLANIQRFGETEILYQQAIALHKKKLLEQKGNEVHIPILKLMKTEPLSTVLYEIIKDFGFSSNQTIDLLDLLKSESGKYIQSGTYRIFKNRNWLIISPNQTSVSQTILIEKDTSVIEFALGKLTIHLQGNNKSNQNESVPFKPSTESNCVQVDAANIGFPLLLRKWQKGDYFYPLGLKNKPTGLPGKKKLSRFFIDQKLSLPQKEKVWVIESDKKIIWVVGLRIDDRFKITNKTKEMFQLTLIPSK